jgi:hypothetical protein
LQLSKQSCHYSYQLFCFLLSLALTLPLTTRLGVSASNISSVPLHKFIGNFSADTDPVLVFVAMKQHPAMNEHWMKAGMLIIEEGEDTIHVCQLIFVT